MLPSLEICTPTLSSALIALSHPSATIELCSSLEVGGLTPSRYDIVRALQENDNGQDRVAVLVRPRGGGFAYNDLEKESIRGEILGILNDAPKGCGVRFVVGCLEEGGKKLDLGYLQGLCTEFGREGVKWTLHRCVDDVISNPHGVTQMFCDELLEEIKRAGFDRVLTSGGSGVGAWEGRERIRMLVEAGRKCGGVQVYAGKGLGGGNVQDVVRYTGVDGVHCGKGAMKVVEGEGIFGGRWEVREEKVRELIEKIEGGGKVGKEDEAKGEYLELTRSRVVDKVSGVLSSYTNSKLAEVGLSAYLAGEGDVEKVMGCIQDLAVFEKEPDAVRTTREVLGVDGWGGGKERGLFFCLLLKDQGGGTKGMAFFYYAYSTWEGRSLYLEDLFVAEDTRGEGAGGIVMRTLAKIAVETEARRFQWQALDWNVKAIEFYEKIGASVLKEWVNLRMEGDGLKGYADGE